MGLEFFTQAFRRHSPEEGEDGHHGIPIEVRSSNGRLAMAFVIFVLYLALGAIVFMFIESAFEQKYANSLKIFMERFMSEHPCVTYDNMERLLEKVIESTQKGVSALDNVTADNNWSFGQSFFFAGTLATTVGFGQVSPNSQPGKAFTILYCIFGIPMFLIVLNGFVARLKYPSSLLMQALTRRFSTLCNHSQLRIVHLFVVFMVLLIFMFIIPASVFVSMEENWTYLDSFYYCFVSLTTIGLGDYIPGDSSHQSHRALYKLFVTCYLMVGILCMMLFMSTIYDVPQLQVSRLFLLKEDKGDRKMSMINNGKASHHSLLETVATATSSLQTEDTEADDDTNNLTEKMN